MANSLGSNPIVVDTDTAAVVIGEKHVVAMSFSTSTGAGTCSVTDSSGNIVWRTSVDGTVNTESNISFPHGTHLDLNLVITSSLNGTGATLLIYT